MISSVLTVAEDAYLQEMADGLVRRYEQAQEPNPAAMYVDRKCCKKNTEGSATKDMFPKWPDMATPLDIFHWMRRIARGVVTDAHPMFPLLMSRLSGCIYKWDATDVENLKGAIREELEEEGIEEICDSLVSSRLTKNVMQKFCRREVRSPAEIERLITDLLTGLSGDAGKNFLGVEILNQENIWEIWDSQKQHLKCIQVGTKLNFSKMLMLKNTPL